MVTGFERDRMNSRHDICSNRGHRVRRKALIIFLSDMYYFGLIHIQPHTSTFGLAYLKFMKISFTQPLFHSHLLSSITTLPHNLLPIGDTEPGHFRSLEFQTFTLIQRSGLDFRKWKGNQQPLIGQV